MQRNYNFDFRNLIRFPDFSIPWNYRKYSKLYRKEVFAYFNKWIFQTIFLSFQKRPYSFGRRLKSQYSVKIPTPMPFHRLPKSLRLFLCWIQSWYFRAVGSGWGGGRCVYLFSIREASRLCPSTLSLGPPRIFRPSNGP